MKLILLYVFCLASLIGDVPKEIQAKLILAQKGDVITLPKGKIKSASSIRSGCHPYFSSMHFNNFLAVS